MLIYVAGPLTAPTELGKLDNVHAAIDVGSALMRKGHAPFIPHLNLFWEQWQSLKYETPTWQEWMDVVCAWLTRADALFYMGPSRGADIELLIARSLGLTIYYNTEEVPDAADRRDTRIA